MRKALIGLVLLPALAACGSDGGSSPAASAPPTVAAVAGPTPEQFAQAKDLAAKLGCPTVEPSPAGGVSNGAVEAECDVPATNPSAEEKDLFTHYTRSILVFADGSVLEQYVQTLRSGFNPSGAQGDRWIVTTSAADDDAKRIQTAVGGTLL
jgi:hypothetical protein